MRTSPRPLRHSSLNPACAMLQDGNETREEGKKSSVAGIPEEEQKATKGRAEKRREWENRSDGVGPGEVKKKKKKRGGEEGKLHKDATLRCAARWT